jgi:hypothetical protein
MGKGVTPPSHQPEEPTLTEHQLLQRDMAIPWADDYNRRKQWVQRVVENAVYSHSRTSTTDMLVAALELMPRPAQRIWFAQCGLVEPPYPVSEEDIDRLPSEKSVHRARVKKILGTVRETNQRVRDCTTVDGHDVTTTIPPPLVDPDPQQAKKRPRSQGDLCSEV